MTHPLLKFDEEDTKRERRWDFATLALGAAIGIGGWLTIFWILWLVAQAYKGP